MHAVTWPEAVEVGPAESAFLSVSVTNTSQVIDAYSVAVFGLDPAWVDVTPKQLSLFPGDTGSISVTLRLPDDYPSSHRDIAVNVVSSEQPDEFAMSPVSLNIRPAAETSVVLDPAMVTGGRKASFGMIVSNSGNAAVTASATALDPEELAEFRFDPARIVVPPGRDQVIRVTAVGGRSWFGQPRARTFQLGVDAERRVETLATFIQRPRIPRWLLTLLALLTAAAVFAYVLSRAFDQVVEEAKVTDELLEAALASGEAGGAVVPANPGTISGVVLVPATNTSSDGPTGLAGVTAEAFLPDDTSTPLASAATDSDGRFALANLGEGDYVIQLSGAGISTIWYGCDVPVPEPESEPPEGARCEGAPVVDPSDAGTVGVALGVSTGLPSVTVEGEPVTLTGVIGGENSAGAQVTIVIAGIVTTDSGSGGGSGGSADGGGSLPSSRVGAPRQESIETSTGSGAVVATDSAGVDGSFTLADVPTPGTYQLVVEKPGFAPNIQTVDLGPGEGLGDIEVVMQPATGTVTGIVTSPDGPVGGATVTVSSGTTPAETVSLTTDGNVGTFTLRNLAVPGQYTISVTKDRYGPATRSVALREELPTADVQVQLLPATGSISGRVTLDGAPARGLQVEVNGPDTQRFADIASTGPDAGRYTVDGLGSPATYTLEFTGPGALPQARVQSIDPGSQGSNEVTGIDANLSRSTTVLRGTVTRLDPASNDQVPAPGATVEVTDGADTWAVKAANASDSGGAGSYSVSGLPPGAYTVSATLEGTERAVELVTIDPGVAPPPVPLNLGAQASILVEVKEGKGAPKPPVYVRLFPLETFPVTSVAEGETDRVTGMVAFTGLDAPRDYVVAVYRTSTGDEPLNSKSVLTVPGEPVKLPIRIKR